MNEIHSDMDKKYEIKLADVEANIQNLIKITNEQDNSLNEIKLKLKDFNIFEIFKSVGNNSENGQNNNLLISLIDNLDNNINSKLKITEDKIVKLEETNFKIKKDVHDIKNIQDLNNRNIDSNKKTLEEIYIKTRELENKIHINLNEVAHKNKDLEDKINENINTNLKKSEDIEIISKEIKNKENNIIINKNIENIREEMNNNIDEKIKEMSKRIIDLEKNFKCFSSQDWLGEIKKEINSLKEDNNKYALNIDLNEIYNRYEEMKKEIKFLREQYEDLSNNQILNEDVQSLKKKFELFNNKIQEVEEFYEILENKINNNVNNKILINENNKKLLEIKVFEEFKSQIIKEFKSVNENFTHLHKMIDEILNSLKNKSTYKDLKTLEEEISVKLEDLRLASTKKFAEKHETIKNFKYLDQEIKHIIQVYVKKADKNENWLIAKRPINSNICASCESYIGDLKDNNPFIPWNKYPLREQGDKIYRLGNGFSKMLQMIQIDENDKKNGSNNNNIQNELNEFVKNMRTEKSEVDIINPELSLNKTVTNNWFKSPPKNLPKIKKGMLSKAKSGININESINNTNNLKVNISGNFENIVNDLDIKKNQAQFSEEEFIRSPRITKIIKITKNEE